MTDKAEAKPTWGYRIVDGAVESKIFTDGNLPKGWKDTPAKLKTNADRK